MDKTQVKSTREQCHPGIIIAILLILSVTVQPVIAGQTMGNPPSIKLPEPHTDAGTSVEQALRLRRSVRTFAEKPLQLSEVAQLLWSAQGITSRDGLRTARWVQKLERVYSSRFPIVELEHTANSFTALNRPIG